MKFSFYPKKSLGQNFLVDKNIINKIVRIGEIDDKKNILEIGPGTGHLTDKILDGRPKQIAIIEKDKNLYLYLKEKYKSYRNINIINNDILDLINNKIKYRDVIVFGNLPYNISTQVLSKLILLNSWPPWYNKLILMFQKEVADRIVARKNSKNFSRLSVLVNWRLNVKRHFDISKNSFFPKPKVDSTLLSFQPKKLFKYNIQNPKNLEMVTRILFSSPRKMINKNLNKLFVKNKTLINSLNIDLKQRPKELDCEVYYRIAEKYEKLFQ